MEEIEFSLRRLKELNPGPALTREMVELYSALYALNQHWPKLCGAEIPETLARWKPFIEEYEFDRFIKQRRIALSRLAEALR